MRFLSNIPDPKIKEDTYNCYRTIEVNENVEDWSDLGQKFFSCTYEYGFLELFRSKKMKARAEIVE